MKYTLLYHLYYICSTGIHYTFICNVKYTLYYHVSVFITEISSWISDIRYLDDNLISRCSGITGRIYPIECFGLQNIFFMILSVAVLTSLYYNYIYMVYGHPSHLLSIKVCNFSTKSLASLSICFALCLSAISVKLKIYKTLINSHNKM